MIHSHNITLCTKKREKLSLPKYEKLTLLQYQSINHKMFLFDPVGKLSFM